ncbi:MAG: 23S rRNA (uracil(1939)-C(5))-methyltransferase RlmD [Clostridia bacterium]|nr:23S rRNA (uracil(1939)-C(5))-methyltransferase RlmD [Clostridia bacterium]
METIELSILATTHDGRGVARADGVVVFVTGALPGDVVLARITKRTPRFCEAVTEEIISSTAARVPCACGQEKCGGCVWNCLSYEKQLEYKQGRVRAAFSRIGKLEVEPLPVIPSPKTEEYRNKVTLHFGRVDGKVILGVLPENSHQVLHRKGCNSYDSRLEPFIELTESWAQRTAARLYRPATKEGLLSRAAFRIGSSGEISLLLITGDGALPHIGQFTQALAEAGLTCFAHATERNPHKADILWGKAGIAETLADVNLTVSPAAFMQVNHEAAEILYKKALEMAQLTPEQTVADLCCGVGSITLAAARHAGKVYGAEISAAAIEDAKKNAQANELEAEFVAAEAGEAMKGWLEAGVNFDTVIVDPPRSGLTEDARQAVLAAKPQRIVYVSCGPETLARDCAVFAANGYAVTCCQPVDLFPNTPHCEAVCALQRQPRSDINS